MPNANELVIRVVGDATQFSRVITQVDAGIRRATGSVQSFGSHGVTNVQAISASLRVAQGDFTNLIRAAERWIARSQTLSAVAKTIFPAIGAIAVGEIFIHGAEEAYKFIETVRKVPRALQDGFNSLNLSAQQANDTLAVTNDRLEIEIAKLEHKPVNTLALALDEAKVAADDLAGSLAKDYEAVTKLITANKIGLVGQLLGKGGTQVVSGSVTSYEQQLSDLGYRYNASVHASGPDSDASKALQKAITDKQNSAIQWATSQITTRTGLVSEDFGNGVRKNRPYAEAYGDQSANLNILNGFRDQIYSQQDLATQKARNAQDTQTKERLTAQQEAARQAAEALGKQQAGIIKAWNEQLAALKNAHDVDAGEEYVFWQKKVSTVKAGSESYREALSHAGTSYQQVLKEQRDDLASAQKGPALLQPNVTGFFGNTPTAASGYLTPSALGNGDNLKFQQEQGKAAADYAKNLGDSIALQRQNADAIAQASLQMAIATGRISAYDAAQVQAALNTNTYQEQLAYLKNALDSVNNDPTLTAIQRQAQASDIQNQITALNGQRTIQSAQDRQNIYSNTAAGGFTDALNQFVTASQDAASALRDITTTTLHSVNADILNGKGFRQTGSDLFKSVAGYGLNRAEGSLLSAFGFGGKKADGSAGNAFHVIVDNIFGSAGSAASGLSSIIGKFNGSSGDDGGDGLFSTIAGGLFQGFFAGGGDVVANRPSIVGERGPEMFVPHASGTIVPNNALGGTTNHLYVDARGSTDPAQTEAAVHRALGRYGPGIISAAVNAVNEQQKRKPLSSR